MGQQTINNGDTGFQARTKINENFTELYLGKDSVTVNTYADLPDPTTVAQQKYWVLTSTGVFLVNRKSRGSYYSDGTQWIYLGEFPTTADQLGNVPAGSIAATNVQAAINELDTEKLDTSHVGTGGTAHANAIASGAAGFMTGTDKAKLDGIATGATANSSDATLLARENHTGTQAIATILAAATSRIFGRTTAGGGIGEELTPAQVRTMINVADGATQNSSDAALVARANHTGTQAIATVLAAATGRFFGRITAGSGTGEELTGTEATSLLDTFTSALKGLAPASGGGTTNFLRADGTWAAPGGGGSPGGNSGELQYNNAGAFAGAANVEVDGGNLKLVSTTDPAAPTSGILLYSKQIAGRHLPKMIGPSGIDTILQVGLSGNSVFMFGPAAGTTAPIVWGGQALTTATTMSMQQTIASANPWQATQRKRWASAATAGSSTGCRTAVAQWFRGNAAGFGGFFFRTQFGQNLNVNGAQVFHGLCASTAVLGTGAGAVAALLNMIGVGYDTTDSSGGNWQLFRNDGAGTATKVDLGSGAARNTNDGYDLIIYCPPGAATEIFVRVTNIHTGTVVLDTSYTTDIPAVNTGLCYKAEGNNGAVASAMNLEIAKTYIETDF